MLRTRSPLGAKVQAPQHPVRLACVRHAASVRPEPGSNSPMESDFSSDRTTWSSGVIRSISTLATGVRSPVASTGRTPSSHIRHFSNSAIHCRARIRARHDCIIEGTNDAVKGTKLLQFLSIAAPGHASSLTRFAQASARRPLMTIGPARRTHLRHAASAQPLDLYPGACTPSSSCSFLRVSAHFRRMP